MKKILLAAVAALAITGCSQNEEIENAGQKAQINFGTVVRNSTKAAIVTTTNFDTFTVSAYKTADDMAEATQLAENFMNGLTVAKNDNNWEYTGTYYWPASGKVQFFATSPAQILDVSVAGYPKFSYTVGAIDTQKDLVAAKLLNQEKTKSALTLPFQHLLTQVNFSIKGDMAGFTYTVTKLELVGVKSAATFIFKATAEPNIVGAWTLDETTGDYVTGALNAAVTTTAALTETTALEAANTALFVLFPQDATAIKAKITYTAAPTTSPSGYTFKGTKEVALTETWAMSQSIRYTLKLTSDASAVTFGNPSMGDWAETTKPEIPTN